MAASDSLDPDHFEALFAHGARMRSLALALSAESGDRSSADDILQEAWVSAMQRPPTHMGQPGAWFARVLANRASDRRRAESARRARETAVARPEAAHPSAEELVARVEVQRKLVEHVLDLPEDYRVVIVERWFEERSPREIARRLGIPASTVRTRLARGLEQLRVRLERAEGQQWVLALAPLTGLAAPTQAGAGSASLPASQTAVASRSLLAGANAKLLAVLMAVLAGWLTVRSSVGEAPGRERTEPAGAVTGLREPSSGAATLPEGLERRERVAVPVKGAESPEPEVGAGSLFGARGEPSEDECARMELPIESGAIEGIVLRGREPVRGGSVWLRRGVRYVPSDPRQPWPGSSAAVPAPESAEPLHAGIGADGRFEFRDVEPDWYTLAIDLGVGTVAQVSINRVRERRQARSIAIVIGSAQIRGHVFDDDGLPVAGARVLASRGVQRNGEQRAFARSTRTAADGAYALTDLMAGTYRVGLQGEGSAADSSSDTSAVCRLAIEQQARVDFGRPSPLPIWSGVLRTMSGEAVHGGRRLFLADVDGGRQFDTLVEEGTGLFRVALPAGRYSASVRRSTNRAQRVAVGVVDVPDAGVDADLVLPGTALRGLAVHARTLEPWNVELPGFAAQSLSLRTADRSSSASLSCGIDAHGRFGFEGLEPGRWILEGSPCSLVEGDGQFEFTVSEGQRELSLTVTIDPAGLH